jgi:hypothetical protein
MTFFDFYCPDIELVAAEDCLVIVASVFCWMKMKTSLLSRVVGC